MEKSKRDGRLVAGSPPSKDESVQNDMSVDSVGQSSNTIASRGAVLQACTVTSGLVAALGIVIRQVIFLSSIDRSLYPFLPFSLMRRLLLFFPNFYHQNSNMVVYSTLLSYFNYFS